MNTTLDNLAQSYSASLREHLNGAGESALKRAYELGREAIASGLGGLDLARVHQDALLQLLKEAQGAEQIGRIVHMATGFLLECLSPLEMAHRGFKEALDTLTASEERYRLLIDTARDVIYTLSVDGTINSLNPAFEQITGWSRSEWLGKSFLPLVHPDDVSRAVEIFERVLNDESPGVFEVRVRSKSGAYIVGEFTTNPRYLQGKIVGTLGIGRDVTERKLAEDRLRESEERFRLIAENVDDLIVVLDTEGRRLYNSPSYKKIMGDPESLRGTDSFADIHPDDRERIRDIFQRTVATGIGERAQYRFHARDGSLRFIESQGSVIKNSQGITEMVIVVARDVTERMKADDEIRKSQKQLAVAQQIAHIGSWEWDVVENKIKWSEELIRIFGLDPASFDGTYQGYLERLHPEDRGFANATITRAFHTKQPFCFEHRIVLTGGGTRTLEGRGEVISDSQGNIIRMTGTAQDITERKLQEEALKALAKRVIEVQEVERHRIARELHDDVCQRLTGIRFSVEDFDDDLPARSRKARGRLKTLLKQIDLLITEVRRMSSNLRPSSLDDFGLVVAMRRLCEDHQRAHKSKVQCDSAGSIPEHYDQHLEIALYRILQEALSNIAKHAHATKVQVLLSQNDGSVSLDVLDNGKGFSPAQVRSKRSAGYGLGLVSMRERSELLGGMFEVESSPGKGTKIHVAVPVH